MQLTNQDAKFAMRCIQSGKATDDEINFLSMMVSLQAAHEDVTKDDYNRLQRLTGGHMTIETPICDR